ncbi:uncharacterized protein [Mytilus edulis]|uniref:uncharacterized protein n=1 Tax=Mytilus edulis TaxID=6550 RepID=UPI0039EE32C9
MTISILSIVMCAGSIVSFIGQILSVRYPRWWTIESTVKNVTETVHFGIWVTLDCFNGACTEESSNSNGEKAWLEGVKVVEVFAVIFLFSSSVISALTIALRKRPARVFLLWKLFTAFSGAAGTVIIMGVLIFFKKKAGLSPSQAISTKDGIADWSMIVSSICGVLSIICSVFIGCKLIMKDSDMDDETDYSKWHDSIKSKEESKKKKELSKF